MTILLKTVEVLKTLSEAIVAKTSFLGDFCLPTTLKASSLNIVVFDFAVIFLLHLVVFILAGGVVVLLNDIVVGIRVEEVNLVVQSSKGVLEDHVVVGDDLVSPYLNDADIHVKVVAAQVDRHPLTLATICRYIFRLARQELFILLLALQDHKAHGPEI
jgi:hypothetical protein